MMCNPKQCKKCGMWWTIKGQEQDGKPFEFKTCGHMAIHMELCKLNTNMLGVRQDTQSRGNRVVEDLDLIMGRPNRVIEIPS